jgi:hypothetical protein
MKPVQMFHCLSCCAAGETLNDLAEATSTAVRRMMDKAFKAAEAPVAVESLTVTPVPGHDRTVLITLLVRTLESP